MSLFEQINNDIKEAMKAREKEKLEAIRGIKKVIEACATNNVAIEINANPHRLDLDWRNLFYAREKGCLITINPDAHSVDGISDIDYGIMIARKAGVQPSEVLNCFTEEDFIKFINRKVERKI